VIKLPAISLAENQPKIPSAEYQLKKGWLAEPQPKKMISRVFVTKKISEVYTKVTRLFYFSCIAGPNVRWFVCTGLLDYALQHQ